MYQIKTLLKYPGLTHAFSTIDDGNMSYSFSGYEFNKKKIFNNRETFFNDLSVSVGQTIALWVQHKEKVVIADRKLAGKSVNDKRFAVKADGILTNEKNLYLFLLIADCLPVIMFDIQKEVIGLIHIGWKNADNNTIGNAVDMMLEKYKSNPKNIVIGFGPAVAKDSFIKENPSQLNDPKWKSYLEMVGNNKYEVDFVGLCKSQLLDKGISQENIIESGVDTVSDMRFFSHYRDKGKSIEKQGRFACLVGLTQKNIT